MIRRLNNPEVRIKALEGRLEQYPSSAAFFPLASLLWEKGEIDRAENLLKNGLATYPNYAAASVLLGEILLSKDEHEQAARFLEKALEITPWNIVGQRLLADCYRKKGDEEAMQDALRIANMFEADEVAAQSIMSDPDPDSASVVVSEGEMDVVATPSLAELYRTQGHLDKARDIYVRLLESEPANTEWKARLAAIQEQMVQGADVVARTGYPEMEENLDLIAGEVKGVGETPAEIKVNDIVPENMEPDEKGTDESKPEGGTETPDADLVHPPRKETDAALRDEEPETSEAEGLLDDGSSHADKVPEVEQKGRESSVSFGEEGLLDEKVVDSILIRMIELYIEEGNNAEALDMCQKARTLGQESFSLLEQISLLEQKAQESAALLLRDDVEEGKDESTPVLALADQRVVDTLEGWLVTLERRKTNV